MTFKITIIGSRASESWVYRMRYDRYRSTPGAELDPFLKNKMVFCVDDESRESYQSIKDHGVSFKNASAVIVILDLSLNPLELKEQASKFNNRRIRFAQGRSEDAITFFVDCRFLPVDAPVYWVGTNSDLLTSGEDGRIKLEAALNENNIHYSADTCFVTSAKTGAGVQECIQELQQVLVAQETIKNEKLEAVDAFVRENNRQQSGTLFSRFTSIFGVSPSQTAILLTPVTARPLTNGACQEHVNTDTITFTLSSHPQQITPVNVINERSSRNNSTSINIPTASALPTP